MQNDKYETQSADVRIVCNKEENGGTFSLSRLANVKFTQDVKCERKTSQSSAPWKTDPIYKEALMQSMKILLLLRFPRRGAFGLNPKSV